MDCRLVFDVNGNGDGFKVGLGVGMGSTGFMVGNMEEVADGCSVGIIDGFAVGLLVGLFVGFNVGDIVGDSVVGSAVGDGVSYVNHFEMIIIPEKVPFARLYVDEPNLSDINQIGTSSPR